MQEELITPEVAQQDIDKWLDYKKIGQHKRELLKEAIDTIYDALVSGELTIKEDFTILYRLKFPVSSAVAGSDEPSKELKELSFKPRLNGEQLEARLKHMKATDTASRVRAYIQALTNAPEVLLKKLDTSDLDVCQSIAGFFIVM